ncbi:hypothetical protein EJ08DRAFT_665545 [Tothia fuscella]|uniref:Heterokaryon incompatibility domain-containing protein n=1 Tax=Tothia fuscella TaxID=1048955 RepID=A0A9P4TTU3_9PEZI|nr:hypothetical protein EJ08DRAFT_665545 [Tothia fuscella]
MLDSWSLNLLALDALGATVLYRHGEQRKEFDDLSLELFALPGDPKPVASLVVLSWPVTSTSSDETFEKAKSWISHCTRKHQRCGGGIGDAMPSRVIDVSSAVNPDPDTVRLCENVSGRHPYICLSHCWGESSIRKSYITTKASIEEKKRSISIQQLPRTLQDTVTIVSNKSRNDYPLIGRGWVYQERLLSPRLLHYTKDEIFWECFETESCLCKVNNKDYEFLKEPLFTPVKVHSWNALYENSAQLKDAMKTWHRVVNGFSYLDLTFQSDKRPALSGLTKLMSIRWKDEFLAGLRRQTLLEDLCWLVIHPKEKLAHYRAPSWSWAAVKGFVRYPDFIYSAGSRTQYAMVVEAKCQIKGTNPFGEVESGHIVLSCQLLRAQLELQNIAVDLSDGEIQQSNMSKWFLYTTNSQGGRVRIWNFIKSVIHIDYCILRHGYPSKVFCLPVLAGESREFWMILAELDDRTFRRIGCFPESPSLRTALIRDEAASFVNGGRVVNIKII